LPSFTPVILARASRDISTSTQRLYGQQPSDNLHPTEEAERKFLGHLGSEAARINRPFVKQPLVLGFIAEVL
jgi:hypothetical protein